MGEVANRNDIVTSDQPTRSGAITPMEMLDRAVSQGANIDTLTKLMDLQERWEKSQARKLFDEAIADAKAEIAPVVRNAKGHNDKKYADFAAIARAVDPVITKHGLSYRFRTSQTDRIHVTCILSHKAGHSEETTLAGPPDASGSKNAIQAIGSTLTYLQRYSLTQALGLAATNDDDGASSSGVITEEQRNQLQDIIEKIGGDVPSFCQWAKINSLAEMPSAQFGKSKQALEAKAKTKGVRL
jgi:hypothetical protein